jgi:hypothetical protein
VADAEINVVTVIVILWLNWAGLMKKVSSEMRVITKTGKTYFIKLFRNGRVT